MNSVVKSETRARVGAIDVRYGTEFRLNRFVVFLRDIAGIAAVQTRYAFVLAFFLFLTMDVSSVHDRQIEEREHRNAKKSASYAPRKA